MRYLAGLILLTLSFQTQAKPNMNESPLSIQAECTGNPQCIFSGESLPITIKIRNESNDEVGLAVEFINRVGPFIKLRDRITQKERQLRVSRASLDLLNVFQSIPPRGTIEIETSIGHGHIRSFRTDLVDLDAEIAISTNIRHSNSVEKFRGVSTLRIIGADTARLNAEKSIR